MPIDTSGIQMYFQALERDKEREFRGTQSIIAIDLANMERKRAEQHQVSMLK